MSREEGDDWTSADLLDRFRRGDESAAHALFARYFDRLAATARSRLADRLSTRVDAEDVALSAYRSFFAGAREGHYVLGRGGDLWRLLSAIARHKRLKRVRHERAARRSFELETSLDRLADVPPDADPGPEAAVALADELERAISLLDPFGRRVLELRLKGWRVSEIAEDSGRSERSVRRSLSQIRDLLRGRLDDA